MLLMNFYCFTEVYQLCFHIYLALFLKNKQCMSRFTFIMNLTILYYFFFLWRSLKQDPGHSVHIFLPKCSEILWPYALKNILQTLSNLPCFLSVTLFCYAKCKYLLNKYLAIKMLPRLLLYLNFVFVLDRSHSDDLVHSINPESILLK